MKTGSALLLIAISLVGLNCEPTTPPEENHPPVADFTISPEIGTVLTTFHLDASLSTDPDAGDKIKVRWHLGDSEQEWDTDYSDSLFLEHHFTEVDTVEITLEIMDKDSLTSRITRSLQISASPDPDGDFTDTRDGHQYKYKKIGTQTWMTENLAYLPYVGPPWEQTGIWVYAYGGTSPLGASSRDYYQKYGCLYDWPTATGDNHGNGKDICPPGWHLPSDGEWTVFDKFIGVVEVWDQYTLKNRDMKLRTSDGWPSDYPVSGNWYGFSAVPAGQRNYDGTFILGYVWTNFWTSTNLEQEYAYYRFVGGALLRNAERKILGYSVRCIAD